jgi:hypothetical protein
MTEQAAELGIPTIQLEIPLKMRTLLFNDLPFSKAFLNVILETYSEVVVPWWPARVLPLLTDPTIGVNLPNAISATTTDMLRKEMEQHLSAYTGWEKK